MTKSPFRFLVHPGAVNISEYIIFADFCKNWYLLHIHFESCFFF